MARAKAEKPYHHGELREALVAAGRKLLEEKGLRGFTLRECARRAAGLATPPLPITSPRSTTCWPRSPPAATTTSRRP